MDSVAIVGASLAGWSCATALRAGGFEGRIVLIGDEPWYPYDRPPLSKAFLTSDLDEDDLALTTPESLVEVSAEWMLGQTAVHLDASARRVVLDDGTSVDADAIVLATGSRPRDLPGDRLPGVHTLRTLTDGVDIRDELAGAFHRLVVVGGGFIGAEVASSARKLGVEVDIVEALPVPMISTFGPVLAPVVAGLHSRGGTRLHTGVAVRDLDVDDDEGLAVHLSDGRTLFAGVVVVGIGVVPNVEWLADSGLRLDDGVVVDSWGRTSAPGIYAAGDVARFPSVRAGQSVRGEHWTHARDHGAAVAGTILGSGADYDPVPYIWSEQYGERIQFAGYVHADSEVEIIEGDLDESRFVAVYTRQGVVSAVLGIGIPRTFNKIRRSLAETPSL